MRVAAPYPQRSAEIFIADCVRALERAQLASGEDAQALARIAWSSHVICIRQFVASVLSKLREISDRRFFESTLLLHPLQGVLCGAPEFTGSEFSLVFEPFGWEFLGQEPQNWPEQELDDYRDYLVDVRGRVLGSEDAAPLQDTRIDQVLFPGFKHCGQVVFWPTLRYSETHFQDARSIPAEASFPTNPEVASATPQVQWWAPTRNPRNQLLERFLHALEKSGVGTPRDRRTVELAKVFQKHLHETASAVLTGLESVSQSRLEFYAAIAYPLKTILTDIGLTPYGWEYCNGPTTDFIRDAGTVDVMHKIRGEGPDIDTRVAGVLYPGFALDDELSHKRLSVHLPTLLSQRMQGR